MALREESAAKRIADTLKEKGLKNAYIKYYSKKKQDKNAEWKVCIG